MAANTPPPPKRRDLAATAANPQIMQPRDLFGPLKFAVSMMGAIPLQLVAVAAFREAIPFLVVYWISLQPPYDDAGGVLPPSPAVLLGLLIRFVGLAFAITVAYRVTLNYYDARYRDLAVRHQSGVRQPVRIVLSGTIRTAGWLILFGTNSLYLVLSARSGGSAVGVTLTLLVIFLASTKLGFVFVAAADGRKSSLKRSFRVTAGPKWVDLFLANLSVFVVVIALVVVSALSIELQRSAWVEYVLAVARTFLFVGIVGGATTFMYRATFPPGSVTPIADTAPPGEADHGD